MVLPLRLHQEEILAYRGGRMGIAAVPGAGKTYTLAQLAARLVSEGGLEGGQEVLVVTLVNSAVDNFYQRIRQAVQARRLLPNLGYRVRTLHGLANDIVRERRGLLLVSEHTTIIDEREADAIRREAATAYLRAHPEALDEFLKEDLDEYALGRLRREQLPELVQDLALSFIRTAKDRRQSPEALRWRLNALPVPLPLAEMSCSLYADYQRSLAYRGALDFDDLICLALDALERDPQYLDSLRHRFPYILEDEAQDSSRLQEQILALLAGPGGNWVRVGDPNQAIYETFTTANPRFLRRFIEQPGVQSRSLPSSGRSTPSIIALANRLVAWTMAEHPVAEVRDALQAPPFIEPTGPGDPQPNPPDRPNQVHLYLRRLSAEEEIHIVADSLQRWLAANPQATVAALAPTSHHGFKLADELRRRSLPFDDSLLRSSATTRQAATRLGAALEYLALPSSPARLAHAYQAWRSGSEEGDEPLAEAARRARAIAEHLRKLAHIEDYLNPEPGQEWLENSGLERSDPYTYAQLSDFRSLLQRWLGAVLLPIDQLVLTLAQDLFSLPNDLALAHKLAIELRRAARSHASWRLPELAGELAAIARNERRFLGFDAADSGFDPQAHPGEVIIATLHKAKGLEWDRVYLLAANTFDFPAGMPGDRYRSEKWFLRQGLNLDAETLAQLEAALSQDPYGWYVEGRASAAARLDYARERLRLLYVGITRARQELVVTWNTGRGGDLRPALALVELARWWEQQAPAA